MSDLLARLIAVGTPADLVAEVAMEIARANVVRAQEAEAAARKEEKRAANARRQREFKARTREEVTQGNTSNALPALVTVSGVTVPALSPSPNENNSNPHPHTHPDNNPLREAEFRMIAWLAWLNVLSTVAKPRKAKPEGIKPHRMPADWQPGPLPASIAEMVDLWPPGRLDREAEACRDYWLDRTDKRPGWDRTFHNRIRDIHDRVLRESRNDRSPSTGRPFAPNGRSDGYTEAIHELQDLFSAYADPRAGNATRTA